MSKPKPLKVRRKMRVHGFYDECWKANVWLIWPCDQAALNAYAATHFHGDLQGDDDEWYGKCLKTDTTDRAGTIQVIVLRNFEMTPECISTLAHECFHAAEYILEGKVAHSNDTSEVFAYLTDSIMRRCLRILTGKKKINAEWD
jgi:hypothetical protein